MRKNRRKTLREYDSFYVYIPELPEYSSFIAPDLGAQFYNMASRIGANIDKIIYDHDEINMIASSVIRQ